MPLTVCGVKATGPPSRVIEPSTPRAEWVGSIACRPLTPAATPTVKCKVSTLHAIEPKAAPLRPSSQSSIWRADTIGTPRACADATMASEPSEASLSVCMLAVKTP